jgi:hypothetical protein
VASTCLLALASALFLRLTHRTDPLDRGTAAVRGVSGRCIHEVVPITTRTFEQTTDSGLEAGDVVTVQSDRPVKHAP